MRISPSRKDDPVNEEARLTTRGVLAFSEKSEFGLNREMPARFNPINKTRVIIT
jgi:hypothetical protein